MVVTHQYICCHVGTQCSSLTTVTTVLQVSVLLLGVKYGLMGTVIDRISDSLPYVRVLVFLYLPINIKPQWYKPSKFKQKQKTFVSNGFGILII